MNGHDVLHQTAMLIRKGWCCGADARDCSGLAVAASDPAATAWSLPGALARVSERPDADLTALRDALWGISGVIPDSSLEGWNDAPGRSQDETLRMLAGASTSLTHQPPAPSGPLL
ncbi:MAG TPA: hypothetical protein VFM43_02245 [Gaiellaceae bacterium]|nr:hypothetical protein [Gaiellaceae bacterium]